MLVAGVLTLAVDLVGTLLIWRFERHAPDTEIHTLGDAFFFTTVQLLTVSSQLATPLTTAGRVRSTCVLEIWALFVVTAVAGSFAAFFSSRS